MCSFRKLIYYFVYKASLLPKLVFVMSYDHMYMYLHNYGSENVGLSNNRLIPNLPIRNLLWQRFYPSSRYADTN